MFTDILFAVAALFMLPLVMLFCRSIVGIVRENDPWKRQEHWRGIVLVILIAAAICLGRAWAP